MMIVLIWCVASLIVASIAHEKRRSIMSGISFLVLSLLLSPLIGFLALIAIPAVPAPPPDDGPLNIEGRRFADAQSSVVKVAICIGAAAILAYAFAYAEPPKRAQVTVPMPPVRPVMR
jgi:hypothetical protein